MARSDKVSSLVKKSISTTLMKVDKLRTGCIWSISDVVMSNDLGHARIYVSVLDDNVDVISTMNDMVNTCRYNMAQSISLKRIPKISFVLDDSLSHGNKITKLINDTNGKS